jgi:hypothetical protein
MMRALLRLSKALDTLSATAGLLAVWLVLVACVISAGNALMRYGLDLSSNAWLEIQWYLFGGMVMLGGAWTLWQGMSSTLRITAMVFVPKPATMDPTKIEIQLDQSSPALQAPAAGDKGGTGEPKTDDSAQDIERLLRQQR